MLIAYTAYERPRRLASITRMATMEITDELTFTTVPGETRVHWAWELHPHGVLKLLAPIVALLGRRQERRIWTSLKRYLESGAADIGNPSREEVG